MSKSGRHADDRSPPRPPPAAPAAGYRLEIPDHELLRCVGRGSYGDVWLARSMVGSYRAVKVVFRSAFKDHVPYDRELTGIRKFEPISRSDAGFVNIFHVGQNVPGGYFFYVMEVGDDVKSGQEIDPDRYVPKTLAKQISIFGRLPTDECLQLGLTLTGALGRLHNQGLIHRDIKPSNIIFVNGAPKLADIGMVTGVGEARSYVGTPGYIPPEGPNSFSSDLYSLGRVLFEAGTGTDGKHFPELPGACNKFPDFDDLVELNEVFMRAGHDNRILRYQTAPEMQADLAVLQGGRSVRRLRVLERRLAKAKKFATVSLAVLAAAGSAAYVLVVRRNASAERIQNRVAAQMSYGLRAMEQGDYLGALPPLVEALRLHQGNPGLERVDRTRLGSVLSECPKVIQMWFLGERVDQVQFSPDGRLILASVLAGGPRLWDVATGRAASPSFGAKGTALSASLRPDGRFVLTAGDHLVSLWAVGSGTMLWSLPQPDQVLDAQFSPRGDRFVTAGQDHFARVYETVTRSFLFSLPHRSGVNSSAFSPDGKWIVTASQDHTAMIWDADTGRPHGNPLTHQDWVNSASFSPDSRYIVSAGYDQKARLQSVADGLEFPFAMEHGGGIYSARFSPDGRYVATAGLDSVVRLWDAGSGTPLGRNMILKHSSRVFCVAFSPDGSKIATGCEDGTMRVWDLAAALATPGELPGRSSPDGRYWASVSNRVIQVGSTEPSRDLFPKLTCAGAVEEAGFNPNGRFLLARCSNQTVTGTTNRTLQVWDPRAGQPVSPPIPFTDTLERTCLSEDGLLLALVGGRKARLVEVASGKERCPPFPINEEEAGAVFDHQAGRLAVFEVNRVYLRDTKSGGPLFSLNLAAPVKDVEFNSDDRSMITAVSDEGLKERSAQIWNLTTENQSSQPLWHTDGVLKAAFSHDGRKAVTASEDRSAVVWDAQTGEPVTPPLTHSDQVLDASFSDDDRWVATASYDDTARVWDARTGEPLTPPLPHLHSILNIVVLSNPLRLISTTYDGKSWLWELSADTHTIAEWGMLTRLLAGNATGATGSSPEKKLLELEEAWRALQASHPADFAVKASQLRAWHENEAWHDHVNGHPAAEDFHRRWLKAHPGP